MRKLDLYELSEDIIEELVNNPVFFCRVVFDTYLWSKQREIAKALLKYKKVAVYSCTGAGKSFFVANIVPYFLQTKEQIIIPIVSPSFRSCVRTVWRPIVDMYFKARIKLRGEPISTRWEVSKGVHYAEVMSARKIEALQGLHSLYQFQVIEEASGIEDWIIDALDGNMTGGTNYRLLIGNPLKPNGYFYNTQFNPSYYKVKISAFDTPLLSGEINEIPKKYRVKLEKVLPTEDWVRSMEDTYGNDSATYKAKVLGEFPTSSDLSMFDVKYIDYAMSIPDDELIECDNKDVVITVDPARMGEDYSVVYVWKGYNVVDMFESKKINLPTLTEIIIRLNDEYKADYIVIDGTGYGAGLYDLLSDAGLNVYSVEFSNKAVDEDKYANLITEMMFNFKYNLEHKLVKLPKSDILKGELLAFEYEFDGKGRFKLITSKSIKNKLKHSPDHAFAAGLRFAPVYNVIGIA